MLIYFNNYHFSSKPSSIYNVKLMRLSLQTQEFCIEPAMLLFIFITSINISSPLVKPDLLRISFTSVVSSGILVTFIVFGMDNHRNIQWTKFCPTI